MAETDGADAAELAALARDYLRDRFLGLPAGRRLGPRLGAAVVWLAGQRVLGLAGPLDIEIILDEPEWARLAQATSAAQLQLHDPEVIPPVRVRVRAAGWLAARLADPEGLWVHRHALLAQDPGGAGGEARSRAERVFTQDLARHVASQYRTLREGFETADQALEPLGRSILLGQAVGSALRLPLLARGAPWPPPQWLVWHVSQVVPEGETLVRLAASAAGGRRVDQAAWASLRRLLDDILDAAGHGETVVRPHTTQQ